MARGSTAANLQFPASFRFLFVKPNFTLPQSRVLSLSLAVSSAVSALSDPTWRVRLVFEGFGCGFAGDLSALMVDFGFAIHICVDIFHNPRTGLVVFMLKIGQLSGLVIFVL